MSEITRLAFPPIIEAILDIECDMPPVLDLLSLEKAAREQLTADYPEFKKRFVEQHKFHSKDEQSIEHTTVRGVQALQFISPDKAQLIQVRTAGYTFNRLAPYGSLDDYIPEIERTWNKFVSLAAPLQIRAIRRRYINRFLVPLTDGKIDIGEFLTISPQLPGSTNLDFVGFLNQYSAVETTTKAIANVVLTSQPLEGEMLPLIFDITVEHSGLQSVSDWTKLRIEVEALRLLKNRIFYYTLTSRCLKLFQNPLTS